MGVNIEFILNDFPILIHGKCQFLQLIDDVLTSV